MPLASNFVVVEMTCTKYVRTQTGGMNDKYYWQTVVPSFCSVRTNDDDLESLWIQWMIIIGMTLLQKHSNSQIYTPPLTVSE